MKSIALNIKTAVLTIFLIVSVSGMFSQSAEQARNFVNRSHIAVAKVQKEMFYANDDSNAADLKKAMKYQLVAIDLYREKKYKDAVGYSYNARALCIELCTKMKIAEGTWYSLNDEEKTYCKPDQYISLDNTALLSSENTKKVEDLNVLDVQKFREFELGLMK